MTPDAPARPTHLGMLAASEEYLELLAKLAPVNRIGWITYLLENVSGGMENVAYVDALAQICEDIEVRIATGRW